MNKLYSILLTLILIPALCVAEDNPAQVIADGWTIVPKANHGKEFVAAMKAHIAYRTEKGDPRHWDVYVPVTGDALNRYLIRSCCDTWAEQDTYRKWTQDNLGSHFSDTVSPHVEKFMHNFTEIDMENSNWGEDTDASYVGVTSWEVKSGKNGQAGKAIKTMSKLAMDNNWPRNWSWLYPVGGSNQVLLATPFENFANMAPMEENFSQFAMKHMKEKEVEKMFESFDGSFSSSTYTIWRHNKELSSPEKAE